MRNDADLGRVVTFLMRFHSGSPDNFRLVELGEAFLPQGILLEGTCGLYGFERPARFTRLSETEWKQRIIVCDRALGSKFVEGDLNRGETLPSQSS